MAEDLYQTLGVARTDDADVIKRAYRTLAKDLHPDKNPGNARAEARFKRVNHAFEVLSDTDKRKLYDEFGEDGLRDGFDADRIRQAKAWQQQGGRRGGAGAGGGARLEDLFGDFMGGGFGEAAGGRGRRAAPAGADLEAELKIDFLTAVRGGTVEIRPQGIQLSVKIPPGSDDASKLRLPGKGAPSQFGGPAGDLLLTLRVEPHARLTRDGTDLHLTMPISIGEAYRGTKVKVPTLDGSVMLKVPEGTQSGSKLRLRGKGVAKAGREAGDMYVHFAIMLPRERSEAVAAAVAAIAALDTEDSLRSAEF
jgi:curved DNA-binding protein